MSKSKLDIRRAMSEHNISYATLSERTGIEKGNISKLFNGNPTLKKMEAVADAIGIDITDLFYPVTDEEQTTPTETEEQTAEVQETEPVQTMAFCPHCGAKVRVGVVLLAD